MEEKKPTPGAATLLTSLPVFWSSAPTHIDRNSLADDSIQVTPSISDRSISTDDICAATPLPGLTTNSPLRTGVLLVTSTSKISAFGKVNPSAGVPDAIAVTRCPR